MTALVLLAILCAEAAPITVEGVPFVRQETHLCGPAALACVLRYYGLDVDQRAIADAAYSDRLRGALITDLEDYARSRGFETRLGTGTMDDVKAALTKKIPVIVLVDRGFWVFSRPHYLVVTGWRGDGIVAHDGYSPNVFLPREEFERTWKKEGCAYLAVWPSSQ